MGRPAYGTPRAKGRRLAMCGPPLVLTLRGETPRAGPGRGRTGRPPRTARACPRSPRGQSPCPRPPQPQRHRGVAHVNTLAGLPAGALAVEQQRVGERLAAQGRVVSDDDGGEASGEVVLGEEPVHLGAIARGDDTEPEPRPREVVKELLDVIEPIGGGGKLGVVLDPSRHEGAIVRNAESLEPGLVRDAKGTVALLD